MKPRPLTQFVTIAHLAMLSAQVRAQASRPEAIFGRLMEKRLDVLAKDPAVSMRAPGKRGMALMQAAGDSALYFLDDEGLRQLSLLFAASAARATPAACARLYTGGADAFPDAFASVMQYADSTLVDRWSVFMVRLTRSGILRPPVGRAASAAEVGATIRRLVAEQPVADRAQLRRGAAKKGNSSDECFFAVTLYKQLGALPANQVGPVVRAMMRGVQPRITAAPAHER